MLDITDTPTARKPSLEAHNLAKIFPPIVGDDFDKLRDNIERNGLLEPIIMHEGKILDGVHRYTALFQLGNDDKDILKNCTVTFEYEISHRKKKPTPLEYVIAKNDTRRHLTFEDRRDVAAKILKLDPSRSDRRVAKDAGISHPTVARVRQELEGFGEVEMVSTRTDAKGIQQPAHKPTLSPSQSAEDRKRHYEKAMAEHAKVQARKSARQSSPKKTASVPPEINDIRNSAIQSAHRATTKAEETSKLIQGYLARFQTTEIDQLAEAFQVAGSTWIGLARELRAATKLN
jgi:ParB-like nuclease domain